MIGNHLLEEAKTRLKGRKIARLTVGLGYTGVKLNTGATGLAATLRGDLPRGCSLLERAGDFEGKDAFETGKLIDQPDVLLSAIGLATINAGLNRNGASNTESPLEGLSVSRSDSVGMVGYFGPLIEPIRAKSAELYVFEREPSEEEYVYPDWAVNSLLPECDVGVISSTTIINGTIDHLLDLAPERTGLLGPSTPLSPALGRYRISHLFGSIVTAPDRALKVISQAGGTKNLGNYLKKVSLRL